MTTELIKYRDENGNVYGVEQSARNKKWIVARTNPGGNRKGAKQFAPTNRAEPAQAALSKYAAAAGWAEVSE